MDSRPAIRIGTLRYPGHRTNSRSWPAGGLDRSRFLGAVVVGGGSALGAGLVSLGIPKDSVIKYETALKTRKFLLIVHGTREAVEQAEDIIGGTSRSSYAIHSEIVHDKPVLSR